MLIERLPHLTILNVSDNCKLTELAFFVDPEDQLQKELHAAVNRVLQITVAISYIPKGAFCNTIMLIISPDLQVKLTLIYANSVISSPNHIFYKT